MKKLTYAIYRPGGNDTALVRGIISNPEERKRINIEIMKKHPNVEQVGFINADPSKPELIMAGGEFCGNATRSAAWEILQGTCGEISIKVSGVPYIIRAGVDQQGNAWAQMPIRKQFETTMEIDADTNIVEMDGITHIVTYKYIAKEFSTEQIKEIAFDLLKKYGLTTCVSAAGVMFVTNVKNNIILSPVVWVRDVQTLFYETACGSGTTAIGLIQAKKAKKNIDLAVIQPSGLPIRVVVNVSSEGFNYAEISGEIQKIGEDT